MQIGIGVFNGSRVWRAYPGYFEALNMWEGGAPEPELCDTDHMWELQPGQQMLFDKFMNPNRPVGRPFIVTPSGFGETIGEASFKTDAYRGQIRLYERLQQGGGFQSIRPTNVGSGRGGYDRLRGGNRSKGLESFGDLGQTRGSFANESLEIPSSSSAGIGLGHEVYQDHSDTGVNYQRNAQPVVFIRVEYREDLQPMLDRVWAGSPWGWYEPMPYGDYWWDKPWTWRQAGPTAPEIPVITPHDPRFRR